MRDKYRGGMAVTTSRTSRETRDFGVFVVCYMAERLQCGYRCLFPSVEDTRNNKFKPILVWRVFFYFIFSFVQRPNTNAIAVRGSTVKNLSVKKEKIKKTENKLVLIMLKMNKIHNKCMYVVNSSSMLLYTFFFF